MANRPIELHSHDPLRYVADMLACIHQIVASEADFLSHLLYHNFSSKGTK